MLQYFTLHTHTNEFDGRNTPAEMVNAAYEKNMRTIGISNHFIVHPDIKQTEFYNCAVMGGYDRMYNENFDVAICKFYRHFDTLEHIAEQNKQMKVLKGMEIDFFDSISWYNQMSFAINVLKPDYTIGACHFIEYNGKLCNMYDISKASPNEQNEMLNLYWTKVQRAIKSGMFTFMAHIDLPRRLNLGDARHWEHTEQRTIHTLADTKTPVEINTALYKHAKAEFPHPAPRIIKMIYNANVPVLLSDDAHRVTEVCRHFDRAQQYLAQHKIQNFCELEKHILHTR